MDTGKVTQLICGEIKQRKVSSQCAVLSGWFYFQRSETGMACVSLRGETNKRSPCKRERLVIWAVTYNSLRMDRVMEEERERERQREYVYNGKVFIKSLCLFSLYWYIYQRPPQEILCIYNMWRMKAHYCIQPLYTFIFKIVSTYKYALAILLFFYFGDYFFTHFSCFMVN